MGHWDGTLTMFDLEKQAVCFEAKAHPVMVNCLDGIGGRVGFGSPEIVTGGRDGAVRVWDPRASEPVIELSPAEGEDVPDCWCVAMGNSQTKEERCIVSGYDNGDIKLYDIRAGLLRYDTNVGNGVCGIEFDRKDCNMNKMVCTTLESKFHVFDLRTHHPEEG